jgi:hypothetical protein
MYKLFISHSWNYSHAYYKLLQLLDNQGLSYYNNSIPSDDPLPANNQRELLQQVRDKIHGSHCVLILAGVYSSYSEWIEREVHLAVQARQNIIAVEPWASRKTSRLVKDNSHKIVRWQGSSIVKAIQELCG